MSGGNPPGVEPEPPTTTTTTEAPGPSEGIVTVTESDCGSVTVTGAGWEQTEATVEVAVPPSEGGESREDLVAGPVQVFPDAEGNIAPTVVPFDAPPPDGDYAAVVLVDNIARPIGGCTLPVAVRLPPRRHRRPARRLRLSREPDPRQCRCWPSACCSSV